MVSVNKIVIHQIIKEPREKKAEKYFAEELIELPNSNASNLVGRINKAFEEDEIVYSTFAETGDSDFPNTFKEYHESRAKDEHFLSFTTKTLEELRKKLINVVAAKGGYYVFAEYTFNKEEFIGVFLIRDTEGLWFKKKKGKKGFDVDTITYMNLDKLAMACRINVSKFQKRKDEHYLTLIRKNQEVISDYFYEWISTSSKESSKEFTEALYDIITRLEPPVNTVTSKTYSLDDLRKDILAFVNEKKREVSLREIGETFYGDKEKLIKFAKDNGITIDHSFKADKRGLNKFKHININSDGIKVQFSHGDFTKKKVRFSDENTNIVIIESEKFANALRKELEDYNIDVK